MLCQALNLPQSALELVSFRHTKASNITTSFPVFSRCIEGVIQRIFLKVKNQSIDIRKL